MEPEPPPIADPQGTQRQPRRSWRQTLAEIFFAASSLVLFVIGALFVPFVGGYLPAPFNFQLPLGIVLVATGITWLLSFSAWAFWRESIKRR